MGRKGKLVSTCLSCLLFALPSISNALGLGDLKIGSHLNEPLEAVIPLVDIKGIEPSDILPTLADPDQYAKAGLEAANWIYHIQFTVAPDKQGKMVIKLKTQHPVQDPFADLLVQVAWPGGKIVREYTLLLDPPKIVTAQAKISASRSNEFIRSLSSPAVEPQAPRMVAQVVKQEYKEVRSDAAYFEPVQFGGRYGPVNGETLWSIAKRLVENTHYSIHQGVAAIAYKNPDAFTNGNINHIKQGAYLKLPSQNEVAKYSQEKAKQFVENQVQYGQSMPVQSLKNEQKEHKPKVQKKQEHKALKLVEPSEETEHVLPKNETTASLTTTHNANQTAVAQSIPNKEASTQQLSLAEEALDTLKRSNEEIKQKNSQLQSQNQSLAEQLAQKEAELNRLKGTEYVQSESIPAPKESPSKMMQPVQEFAVVTPEPDAHKNVMAEQHHLPINSVSPVEKNKSDESGLAQNTPERHKQEKVSKELATTSSSSDHSKGNFVFVAFVIAFTLSILGWLWFSRHRFIVMAEWLTKKLKFRTAHKQKVSTSLVSDVPQEEIQVNYSLQFDLEKALSAVAKEEKKFTKSQPIVSLNKEDHEAIHKKSLASLEDAEIYIAYERYQQAEKLLQDILTSETSQEPLYWEALLRLLELYVLTEKYNEYEKWYATIPSELKEIAPKVWSKIMLLQDKVQADRAIPSPAPPSTAEDADEKMALATHHIPEMPLPATSQEKPQTQKVKLELVEKDNDEINAQLALARTYQNVGDVLSAKEVLLKLLQTVTDDKLKEQIQKMIAEIGPK